MISQHNASHVLLGYYYQSRYALYLMMKYGNDDTFLSIEKFDDIAFEQDGTPIELIQSKHHIRSCGNLTDASVDLWKTIHIWCKIIKKYNDNILFNLITTSTANEGSIAHYLTPNHEYRNPEAALKLLIKTAHESSSEQNKPAYELFKKLPEKLKKKMLDNIYIIDKSPNITDLEQDILHEMRLTTRPEHKELIFERIEGWWHQRVINYLVNEENEPLSFTEFNSKLNDIREQFNKDNLPIDFPRPMQLEEEDVPIDDRIFIEQLRIIMLGDIRIHKAISDYYRAFQQRSIWVREDLLLSDELEIYEERLVDEWERIFFAVKDDLGSAPTPEDYIKNGKFVFTTMERRNINIRHNCQEPYIMRGSYHILANQLKVGWHGDFLNQLKHLLQTEEVT